MKCWLCNKDCVPGEGRKDPDGDIACIDCENRINFTVELMREPKLIPLVAKINELPRVAGVSVGLRFEEDEE